MTITKTIVYHIDHSSEGLYLTIPFEMPARIQRLTVSYAYPGYRFQDTGLESGTFTHREHANVVDLGLIAPDGHQVGATGSNKLTIFVSEKEATLGCTPTKLVPGTWRIMVGAAIIQPEGLDVEYTLTFEEKQPRWLKGDLHTHTVASDGWLTIEELALHAKATGLDFIAVTDHNQLPRRQNFPKLRGLTILPGVEWTHYRGHSNFLGIETPYDTPFCTNTDEEMRAIFQSAHDRGALINLNHPQDSRCRFSFSLQDLPFDTYEIWNGPMIESNLLAISVWHQMLVSGRKQVATAGSDYHHDELFRVLGGPTNVVLADSDSEQDILAAVKAGRSYFIYDPNGPSLEMSCNGLPLGSSLPWHDGLRLDLQLDGLQGLDEIHLISADSNEIIFRASSKGKFTAQYPVRQPGFLRLELWRTLHPGLPSLPLLISNPIWFDQV